MSEALHLPGATSGTWFAPSLPAPAPLPPHQSWIAALYKALRSPPAAWAGFAYDSAQDIFFAKRNPPQRQFGYRRAFDEAAAAMNMIIDCEPFIFPYDGRTWLLELWKGMYGLSGGGEIGIYVTDKPANPQHIINQSDPFSGYIFAAPHDDELLPMQMQLFHDGNVLFNRSAVHWWTTGFRVGAFTPPDSLAMEAHITFPTLTMLSAFVRSAETLGYFPPYLTIHQLTAQIVYHKPKAPQPLSRTPSTDAVRLMLNHGLCEAYQAAMSGGKFDLRLFKSLKLPERRKKEAT